MPREWCMRLSRPKFQTRHHPAARGPCPCSVLATATRDDKKAANEADMVNDRDAAPLGTFSRCAARDKSESKGSESTARMLPRRRIMYGQEIFHRRPDPSLNVADVRFRLASGAKWRLAERRAAMGRLLVNVRHQQWVRAKSAKVYRPPTLLEDNPTSG